MSLNNRDMTFLTKDELAVLEIIKNHRALVKTIADFTERDENNLPKDVNYHDVDFILDQIDNPTENRPSRSLYAYGLAKKENPAFEIPSIVKKTNLKTKKVHDHKVGQCRYTKGLGKEYQHTLKTSTSLLSPEPECMPLFGYDAVGFLWDIDTCDIKDEKYIWEFDGMTAGCGWLSPPPFPVDPSDLIVTTIAATREKQKQAIRDKKKIDMCEFLVGLPKGIVCATFATRDSAECRLRAWNVMLRAKEKLKLEKDLPVLVIAADMQDGFKPAFRVYTAADREKDLIAYEVKPVVNHKRMAALKTKLDFHNQAHRFFASSEEYQLKHTINKLIRKLNDEINSSWPYPNKDRKRIKVDMLQQLRTAISNHSDVIACINMIENEHPEALAGIFSDRTYTTIQRVKRWAERYCAKPAGSERSCPAA